MGRRALFHFELVEEIFQQQRAFERIHALFSLIARDLQKGNMGIMA